MLLRFGVANHRSIRDYQELHLSASKRIKRKGLVIPVPTLKEGAVPIVALYGGNAAGKSNLIDAMDEIQRAIVRSHNMLGRHRSNSSGPVSARRHGQCETDAVRLHVHGGRRD